MLNRNIEENIKETETIEYMSNKTKALYAKYKKYRRDFSKYASLEEEKDLEILDLLESIYKEARLTRQWSEFRQKQNKKSIITIKGIRLAKIRIRTKQIELLSLLRKKMLIFQSSLCASELIEKFKGRQGDILGAYSISPARMLSKAKLKEDLEISFIEQSIEYLKELQEALHVETLEELIISNEELPLEIIEKLSKEEVAIESYKKYFKNQEKNQESEIENPKIEDVVDIGNEVIKEKFGEEQYNMALNYVKEGRVILHKNYGTPISYEIANNNTYIEVFESEYHNTAQLYAHELGHAILKLYKYQKEVKEENNIYIEIPSTVYEIATAYYLAKQDKKISCDLVHLEYCSYVLVLHIEKRLLNGEEIEDILEDVNTKVGKKDYFNLAKIEMSTMYETLPYVIGYIVAFNIVERMENKEEGLAEKYTEYLKNFHSMNGYEALKKYLDIDLKDMELIKKSQEDIINFSKKFSK